MKIKSNVVKGWITSLIGILFMGASLFLWFFGLIDMVWDGIAGIIFGVILLYAPRTIEKKLSEVIKAWGSKGNDWGGGGIDIDIGNRGGGGGRHHNVPVVPPTPDTNEPSIKDEPK